MKHGLYRQCRSIIVKAPTCNTACNVSSGPRNPQRGSQRGYLKCSILYSLYVSSAILNDLGLWNRLLPEMQPRQHHPKRRRLKSRVGGSGPIDQLPLCSARFQTSRRRRRRRSDKKYTRAARAAAHRRRPVIRLRILRRRWRACQSQGCWRGAWRWSWGPRRRAPG